jgi:hypothetical protein
MPEELEPQEEAADLSHDLDMVTIFSSSNYDAEMEAMSIHGILESSGISAEVIGTSTLPVLEFQVQVPREDAEEARRLLAEAQAGGPAAAAEAEAEGEAV